MPAAPRGAAGTFSGWIIQTIHLVGVELEEVGDDFGFGRVGRKAENELAMTLTI